MFGIPIDLLIYGSIANLSFVILYPLRQIKLFKNPEYPFIIKFAAFVYKIFPEVSIVFGIFIGYHLHWYSPFLFGLITWPLAVIIGWVLVASNLIMSTDRTPPIIMFFCALVHIVMVFLLFNHYLDLTSNFNQKIWMFFLKAFGIISFVYGILLINRFFGKSTNPFSSIGRIGRIEYLIIWIIYLTVFIFCMLIWFGYPFDSTTNTYPIFKRYEWYPIIIFIVAIWVLTAASTKRLHDIGYSGWWQIPIVYVFPIFVFGLFILKGERGSNKYGNDPKEKDKFISLKFDKNGLYINDILISENFNTKEVKRIIGSPSRSTKHEEIKNRYQCILYTYDNMGIVLYEFSQRPQLASILICYKQNELHFYPKQMFKHNVILNNEIINPGTTEDELRKLLNIKYKSYNGYKININEHPVYIDFDEMGILSKIALCFSGNMSDSNLIRTS